MEDDAADVDKDMDEDKDEDEGRKLYDSYKLYYCHEDKDKEEDDGPKDEEAGKLGGWRMMRWK